MARFFAQIFTVIFFVVGLGALLLGDAGTVSNGQAHGNMGSLTLHLTWTRDILDIALCIVLSYVGFIASRSVGKIMVIAVGILLTILAIVGFMIGDDALASKGFMQLHFAPAINIFDLVVGILAILAGLGTLSDEAAQS